MQGIFRKENTDKALKYGIYRHLPTYEKIIRNLVSFLIKELNLAGYHLPDDMAIGAFDNTYLSNSQILTLTTLSHKSHEMGTAAANMMIQQLKGIPVTFLEVPWTLIPKGSTPDNLLDNL